MQNPKPLADLSQKDTKLQYASMFFLHVAVKLWFLVRGVNSLAGSPTLWVLPPSYSTIVEEVCSVIFLGQMQPACLSSNKVLLEPIQTPSFAYQNGRSE